MLNALFIAGKSRLHRLRLPGAGSLRGAVERSVRRDLRRRRSERGSVAVTALIFMTLIIGGSLGAIDLARHNAAQLRLNNALDAAVISAGRNLANYTPVNGRIQEEQWVEDARAFFRANMPDGYLGSTVDTDRVEVTYSEQRGGLNNRYLISQTVDMRATGRLPLLSTGYMGISSMSLTSENQAIRRNRSDLEVVLVLDNTGSMREQNRLSTLKTASKDLIGTVLGAAELGSSRAFVGLVPFDHVVNVGNNEFTRQWLRPPFNNHPFVTSGNWNGCIAEPRPGDRTEADITRPGMQPGNFLPLVSEITWSPIQVLGVNSSKSSPPNIPTGARILPDSTSVSLSNNAVGPPSVVRVSNQDRLELSFFLNPAYCPRHRTVQFLTDNQRQLELAVDAMVEEGHTAIPTGILWGWRMLDAGWNQSWSNQTVELADGSISRMPRPPHRDLNKVMVLLTDGANIVQDFQSTAQTQRLEDFRLHFTYEEGGTERVQTGHGSRSSCEAAGHTWETIFFFFGRCYQTISTVTRGNATYTETNQTISDNRSGSARDRDPRMTSLHLGSENINPYGRITNEQHLDNLTLDLCANVKRQGIQIYTVALGNTISTAVRNMMMACASPNGFYDSRNTSDLPMVFASIAGALMELRLTK